MPEKILVADDSQTIRSVAEFLLRQKGFDIILAQDGVEALSLIKKSLPALVLLDNSMPLMDGYTLCQELKKDYSLKKIPVVMLLNSRESLNQEEFKNSGCEGYIFKPFSPREFLEKVGEFLKIGGTSGKSIDSKSLENKEIKEPTVFLSDLQQLSKFDSSKEETQLEDKVAQPALRNEDSYQRFVTEFKKEMEGLEQDEPLVYREMRLEISEEKKEEGDKDLDYLNLTHRIVKEVSSRVAEKIAEKIDPQEIEQMIKEKIKELV